jgi:hypothetical protein
MQSSAQKRPTVAPAPHLSLVQGGVSKLAPDAILAGAQALLNHGFTVLDDRLAGQLESLVADVSLPPGHRARALSLMCRFG